MSTFKKVIYFCTIFNCS